MTLNLNTIQTARRSVLNYIVACRHYSLKHKAIINKHYEILGLKDGADQESVRRAFVALCKIYHPDSGNPNADPDKFHEIESSYRALQGNFTKERWDVETDLNEVQEYDIRHTAPQHREFLSWDGVGSGTPSQRQQQYGQLRAAKAATKIMQHRIEKLEGKGNELTTNDKIRVKDIRTGFGMDRVVEDLIQESMTKGEFSNLSGSGKPLKENSCNHYVDFVTQKMNEILIQNGFTPEWISLGKEIEQDVAKLKQDLQNGAHYDRNSAKWKKTIKNAEESVKSINKKIQNFNLIVPILARQMFNIQLEVEVERALSEKPETVKFDQGITNHERNDEKSIMGVVFGLLGNK